jgi:hypothetical protein
VKIWLMLELTYTLKMVNPYEGQINVSGRWHPNKRHLCDMKFYSVFWHDLYGLIHQVVCEIL